MLTADQKDLIETEIAIRWESMAEYLTDARLQLNIIRTLKACLALNDSLKLRVVPSEGEAICQGPLRVIQGSARQTK